MLPATPEADELQQLPLELPRYLLVALRESGGHRAYALLPPYGLGWQATGKAQGQIAKKPGSGTKISAEQVINIRRAEQLISAEPSK